MRFIKLLVSIIVISFVLNIDCDGDGSNYKDCKDRKVEASTSRCCFLTTKYTFLGEKVTEKGCEEVTKHEYENINDYITTAKEIVKGLGAKDVDLKVDCNSSYLTLSILGLIMLLL